MSKHSGKLLLWAILMLTFSLQALAVGASVRKGEKSAYLKDSGLTISGEYIEYINIAFNDYMYKQRSGPSEEIRYFKFYISEKNDLIKVNISFDNDLLMKEKNEIAKGGEAEYSFKRGIKKIQDVILHK